MKRGHHSSAARPRVRGAALLALAIAALAGCSRRHAVPSSQPATIPSTRATTAPATTRATTGPVINRWEEQVRAYLDMDAALQPDQGGIVFVGSSSIRGWRSLQADFPDLNVIGRGVGGCEIIDTIRYADVLVLKHRPTTVVFYAGENDLASGTPPETVLRHFQTFVDLVHHELPRTRVLFITCKPSPSRFGIVDRYRRANELIRQYIATNPRLGYIDVFTPMLDADGRPHGELFVGDRLHMNAEGYRLWTGIVRAALDATPADRGPTTIPAPATVP